MLELVIHLLVLGAASAAFSVTVARSHVFGPLRGRIAGYSGAAGALVSCHYCMGHWAAAASLAAWPPAGWTWYSIAVMWLAVTALSGYFSRLITGD